MEKENTQITKIRNENSNITTDPTKIKKIVREYNEQKETQRMGENT